MVTTRSGLTIDPRANPPAPPPPTDPWANVRTYRPPRLRYRRTGPNTIPVPTELRYKTFDELLPNRPSAWTFDEYIALCEIKRLSGLRYGRNRQSKRAADRAYNTKQYLWSGPWRIHFAEPVEPQSTALSSQRSMSDLYQYLNRAYGRRHRHKGIGINSTFYHEWNDYRVKHMFKEAFVCFIADAQNYQLPHLGYGYEDHRKDVGRLFFFINLLQMRQILMVDIRAAMADIARGIGNILNSRGPVGLKEVVIHIHDDNQFRPASAIQTFSTAQRLLNNLALTQPAPPIQEISVQRSYNIIGDFTGNRYLSRTRFGFRPAPQPAWAMNSFAWNDYLPYSAQLAPPIGGAPPDIERV